MRKEFSLIMVSCIIGISSAYGDSQINITQSLGQTVSPVIVANSTNNVLFQVLSDGQAIINKFIQFSGSGLTALRTYVFPDSSGTVVLEGTPQTLLQKTIDADSNTITNIDNNEIKVGAGIDVSKLSSGSVDNTEFGYLDGIGGNIQALLNGKIDNGVNVGAGAGLVFKDKSGMNLRFKTINAGNNIAITNNADDITINATSVVVPNVNGTNVGTGTGIVFKDKSGDNLRFRTVKAGNNITITNNADDITINATSVVIPNVNGTNVGTGTGIVFKDKSGDNLRFKTIKAGNSISITNNADDVTINATSIGIPSLLRLSSDVSTTSNTCCTDATGLSFSVSSGKVYHFKFLVIWNSTLTTKGIGLTLNGPATTFLTYDVIYPDLTTTGEIHGRNSYNSEPNPLPNSPALANNLGIIEGLIQPSADGTLIVRFESEGGAGTTTIKAKSVGFLTVIP